MIYLYWSIIILSNHLSTYLSNYYQVLHSYSCEYNRVPVDGQVNLIGASMTLHICIWCQTIDTLWYNNYIWYVYRLWPSIKSSMALCIVAIGKYMWIARIDRWIMHYHYHHQHHTAFIHIIIYHNRSTILLHAWLSVSTNWSICLLLGHCILHPYHLWDVLWQKTYYGR